MSEYIMECKTVQTGVFKTLVEALKDILTDINIEFHKGNSESPNDDEKGYIKMARGKDLCGISQSVVYPKF